MMGQRYIYKLCVLMFGATFIFSCLLTSCKKNGYDSVTYDEIQGFKNVFELDVDAFYSQCLQFTDQNPIYMSNDFSIIDAIFDQSGELSRFIAAFLDADGVRVSITNYDHQKYNISKHKWDVHPTNDQTTLKEMLEYIKKLPYQDIITQYPREKYKLHLRYMTTEEISNRSQLDNNHCFIVQGDKYIPYKSYRDEAKLPDGLIPILAVYAADGDMVNSVMLEYAILETQ